MLGRLASCLLQCLRIDLAPVAEHPDHRSEPIGSHSNRKDSAQPRHLGREDGWDLRSRECHANLGCAYAQDRCWIDLRETFGELLDHLVVESALCRGDEESSTDSGENWEQG